MENPNEEPAPPGYMWTTVRTYVDGHPVDKRELVKLMMCGAPTEMEDPDEEIIQIVNEIKPQIEQQTNKTYEKFEAVKFTSQVVAGTIYRIKVKIAENKYLHISVLKELPCNGGGIKPKLIPGEFTLEDEL